MCSATIIAEVTAPEKSWIVFMRIQGWGDTVGERQLKFETLKVNSSWGGMNGWLEGCNCEEKIAQQNFSRFV